MDGSCELVTPFLGIDDVAFLSEKETKSYLCGGGGVEVEDELLCS